MAWLSLPGCNHVCPKNSHSCADWACTMRTLSTIQSGCGPLPSWLRRICVRGPSSGACTWKMSTPPCAKAPGVAPRARGLLSPAKGKANFALVTAFILHATQYCKQRFRHMLTEPNIQRYVQFTVLLSQSCCINYTIPGPVNARVRS